MITQCTQCGQRYEVEETYLNKRMKCLKCQQAFDIKVWQPTPQGTPVASGITAAPAATAPAATPVTRPRACARHPQMAAVRICNRCQKPICQACSLSVGNEFSCPDCARAPAAPQEPAATFDFAAPAAAPAAPFDFAAPGGDATGSGDRCVQHPTVAASHYCRACRAPVCETCLFTFPGNLYFCPRCATSTAHGLSSQRKSLVGFSYALAVFATFGIALVFGGAFAGPLEQQNANIVGLIIMAFSFFPALVGMALSIAATESRLANPAVIWAAIGWNVIIVIGFVMLVFVGLTMGN